MNIERENSSSRVFVLLDREVKCNKWVLCPVEEPCRQSVMLRQTDPSPVILLMRRVHNPRDRELPKSIQHLNFFVYPSRLPPDRGYKFPCRIGLPPEPGFFLG